jgi:hypothetical protein
MSNATQISIVLVGVLVPVAFVLFVISVTRRRKEIEKLDGLFAAIARLQQELHSAFAAEKPRSGTPGR